jgi:hypothetical protein
MKGIKNILASKCWTWPFVQNRFMEQVKSKPMIKNFLASIALTTALALQGTIAGAQGDLYPGPGAGLTPGIKFTVAIRPFKVQISNATLLRLKMWTFTSFMFARKQDAYKASETWARHAYPGLIYFREVDKGGYFAARDQPQLFSEELRAAFRSLR